MPTALNEDIRAAREIKGTLGTQIFLSVATLVGIWLVFFTDYTPLKSLRIQSPITFQSSDATQEGHPATIAAATAPIAANDEEQRPDLLTTLKSIRPHTDRMEKNELSVHEARVAYIARYAKTAVGEMQQYGIPASITLAQGILESGQGTSALATKANNHFGIKCFSKRCKTGHCINRTDDTHKDFFIKYKSAWESYRAHSKLLKGPNYAACFDCGKDYRCWAETLKRRGYATARDYAESLIRIIEIYELYRLDR